MADVLTDFVIDQIWCGPGQDKELNLKPRKIHGPDPVFGIVNYLGRDIPLPNLKNSWYIYQIGTYYQSDDLLGIYQKPWEKETWKPLTKPLVDDGLMTTVFTAKGITFPLFQTYYIYTTEKALLIAVEQNNKIPASLLTEDLYIRFYDNAFRESTRAIGTDYSMKAENKILTATGDINIINARIQKLTLERGQCILSINGQRYRRPDSRFVAIGDIVEWIYDPTIEYVETYPLSQISSYLSFLDGEDKYVLHSPSKSYFTTIAYQDDLELELYTPLTTNGFYGAYLPLFNDTTLRMLTHRDFALRRSTLDLVRNSVSDLNPSAILENFRVEIKFRKSGLDRPIRQVSTHVADLYTLSDSKIYQAIGQNPVTYTGFNGAYLESAPYVLAMNKPLDQFTQEFSEDVLGYNVLSLTYGTEAKRVTTNGSVNSISVPELYQDSFTAYEYNFNGLYLQNIIGSAVATYTAQHPSCSIVELIQGQAAVGPNAKYGNNNLVFNPLKGYRVWACNKIDNAPTFDWVDITGTNQYVEDRINGIVSWSNPTDARYMMLRDDSKFSVRTFSQVFLSNLMTFTLMEYVDQGVGFSDNSLDVPGSDVQIFMNGRSLIRGIDYFIQFPAVYITNFAYLNQEVVDIAQLFHYRIVGLGDGSGSFESLLDTGTVSHGFIGTSGRYVAKNDKPIRVSINGGIRLTSAIRFSQDYLTTEDGSNGLNGLPYEVKNHSVGLTALLLENAEVSRSLALADQVNLVNYMNMNVDSPVRGAENLAPSIFLVCPFHALITDDLINGNLTAGDTNPANTTEQVLISLQPYLNLVDVSPCNPVNGLRSNPQFKYLPHPRTSKIALGNANNLSFMTRVSDLIFPDLIVISNYYT